MPENVDPQLAAETLAEGIGRRRLLAVAGALGAAAAVSGCAPAARA
ncbi:MAG: hypothetical protein JWM15_2616, partial [Cryptosporangiaceae bacterium]|nr:hypothetical protein [Cryptosporangiaceae bacterium]